MKSDEVRIVGCGAPVLAVCGFSGSGKTTLLEAAAAQLVARGLAVAVVKHDAHGFVVDRPGKDSDRFFRAGATVALRGPQEQVERRQATAALTLETTLARLGQDHDLILVEGHKQTPLQKIWLSAEVKEPLPDDVTNVVLTLRWGSDRLRAFMDYVDGWLPRAWNARPLNRGMLMGGMSSRMGAPKQMMRFGERMLGEIAAEALAGGDGAARVIAIGSGAMPDSLKNVPQLPDVPEYGGPGAALITAHRWVPDAGWIVAACDHPWLGREHIDWLAAQRKPGTWAVIPRQSDGHPCPMLALYEPQGLEYLERAARTDRERNARPSVLPEMPRAAIVDPPAELARGWKNVNTPEELHEEAQRIGVENLAVEERERG